MKNLMLSVVIPSYNEELLLPLLLDSLKKQTFKNFEVIVADNKSTDRTPEIVKNHGAKLVSGANRPGIGRNNGAKHAVGEYLVFFDADTSFDENFLEKLNSEIQKKNFGVASGFFVGDAGNLFDRLGHKLLNYYFWILQKIDPHAYGFYFVVKRSLFERVGGFDPEIVMAEDHELAARIKKQTKAKFSFLRKPAVTTSVRRVSKEGFFSAFGKGFYVEIYRIFNKRITKKLFDYRMGGGEGKLPE